MTARAAARHVKLAFVATPFAWAFVVPIAVLAVLWLRVPGRLAPNAGWLLGSIAWSLALGWLSVAPLARWAARDRTLLQFVAMVVIVAIECGIAARTSAHDAWLWHALIVGLAAIPTLLVARSCEGCRRIFALRGLAFRGERRTTTSADAEGRPLTVVVEEGTDVSACAYCGAVAKRAVKREVPLVLLVILLVAIGPYLIWRAYHARLVPRA
jgi:hypothetical protein